MPDKVRVSTLHKGNSVVVSHEYREFSDEELEQEAREAKIQELVNKKSRSNSENTLLQDLLAWKQGAILPKSKNVRKVR